MVVILTEKPSQGRNFGKALGGMTGSYKGTSYKIVSARGHLYTLADPEDQVPSNLKEEYSKWTLNNLPWDERKFAWKYKKGKDTSSLLSTLKKEMSGVEEVVIGTDDDPTGEGQMIAWNIINGLKLIPKKITRMYFEDESESQIRKAFENRKVLPLNAYDDPEYKKAFYRSRWDFLSMQFTRLTTLLTGGGELLRQGRLKSAMVVLVGDQLDKYNSYVKKPMYSNKFKDENGVIYTNQEEEKFENKEDVKNIYTDSKVKLLKKEKKQTSPPKYIDLSSLAAKLAPKGIDSKTTLATYQKLYEAGFVSYPRTEDKYITSGQFKELLPFIDKIADVVGVNKNLLTVRTERRTHIKEGMAHGANRPGKKVPNSLTELSRYGKGAEIIYEILAKNYLASLAEDYEYIKEEGELEKYPKFKGSVNVPFKMGWKAVYDDESETSQGKGIGTLAKPFVGEDINPRPAKPTMKWLMKELEKRDIGTGATRTSTYSEVTSKKSRGQILKDTKGSITLEKAGDISYKILPGTNIGSLDLTEKVEKEMKEVEKGELNPEIGLMKIRELVKEDIEIVKININKLKEKGEFKMENNNYSDVEYAEGVFAGKPIRFKRVQRGVRLTDEELETLFNGGTITKTFKAKSGNDYTQSGKLKFGMEYGGRTYDGIDWQFVNSVPTKWAGHTFTKDEILMLEAGETVYIENFKSKAGNTFAASVTFEQRAGDSDKKMYMDF